MVTALLVERGLSVGTYTSPHLERINERMAWNDEPISDDDFAETIRCVADLEPLLGQGAIGQPPTHFEILTAAAYRWFADVAVDVAVVEVGLGGRWDATNVADGEVAIVTNVSLDHAEVIGPTLTQIAEEKAGIVKRGSRVVIGETDPELAEIFVRAGCRRRRRGGLAAGPGLRLPGQRPGPRRAPGRPGHARRPVPGRLPPRPRRPPGRQRGGGAGRCRGLLRGPAARGRGPGRVRVAPPARPPRGGRPRPAVHPRRCPQPGRGGGVHRRHPARRSPSGAGKCWWSACSPAGIRWRC